MKLHTEMQELFSSTNNQQEFLEKIYERYPDADGAMITDFLNSTSFKNEKSIKESNPVERFPRLQGPPRPYVPSKTHFSTSRPCISAAVPVWKRTQKLNTIKSLHPGSYRVCLYPEKGSKLEIYRKIAIEEVLPGPSEIRNEEDEEETKFSDPLPEYFYEDQMKNEVENTKFSDPLPEYFDEEEAKSKELRIQEYLLKRFFAESKGFDEFLTKSKSKFPLMSEDVLKTFYVSMKKSRIMIEPPKRLFPPLPGPPLPYIPGKTSARVVPIKLPAKPTKYYPYVPLAQRKGLQRPGSFRVCTSPRNDEINNPETPAVSEEYLEFKLDEDPYFEKEEKWNVIPTETNFMDEVKPEEFCSEQDREFLEDTQYDLIDPKPE